jgi:aryl-alcohol dehydrogenase-like predicted oxidoreductase
LADLRGWAPVVGVQIEYSLADRTADREILPMAKAWAWARPSGRRWVAGS